MPDPVYTVQKIIPAQTTYNQNKGAAKECRYTDRENTKKSGRLLNCVISSGISIPVVFPRSHLPGKVMLAQGKI